MNVQSLSEINAAYATAINEIQERTGVSIAYVVVTAAPTDDGNTTMVLAASNVDFPSAAVFCDYGAAVLRRDAELELDADTIGETVGRA